MQYKEILENISDWLWKVDTSGKYTYCSPNVFDFLGYTAEEVVGKTPFDFMSVEEALRVSSLYKDLIISRVPIRELENTNIHKNGSIVILKTSGVPIYDENGVWIGYEGTDTDITEKKVLEQTKINYELLHKLTENIPGAIYQYRLYPDGRFCFPYASKGMENVYELSSQEVIQDASLIFEKTHKDDVSMFEASVIKSIETMTEWNIEYRVNLPKKGLRWLHGKSTPERLEDGSILWNGVISDITEQVAVKEKMLLQAEQLKQKKQELESIISNAPNPMNLHDESGKILMLNQAWINSSGFTFADTPTIDDWLEHVYDDVQSRVFTKKHIDSLYEITEKVDEGEFTFLNKNRDLVTWQVSSAPMGVINGKRTIISSAMDISELKRKDELIIAQSRHAAMGEMISMIAHQWRQPVNIISLYASNMEIDLSFDAFSNEKAEEYSQGILIQTEHLSKTIDDFRSFFKADKESTPEKMQSVLENAISIMGTTLKDSNIKISIKNESDSEFYTYSNELVQVLINLINNAREALIESAPKEARLTIKITEDEEKVYVVVCNNAGKIPKEILEHLGEPYVSSKSKNGTGLGVYMSKVIVTKHLGGTLSWKNKEDGACFTIALPLKTN